MVKRVLLVAIVAAAILAVVAPAMAFNGYRASYTTSDYCSICHRTGAPGSAPKVYDLWHNTKHAVAGAGDQAIELPYGSSCAGCHTSNYSPSKVVPTPVATDAGAVTWQAANGVPTAPQASGAAASSENFVGCSACHYGASTGDAPQYGNDANDTAHMAPNANLANAAICGQCHSRYSYTVNTFTVAPVPYVAVDASGSPIPNPDQTTLLQPQYAIGFKMLGEPTSWVPGPLSSVLNVASQGVTPTPNPSATSADALMKYWQIDGVDTPWTAKGHDGSATQYTDWSSSADLHSQSLDALKAVMGPNPPAACLECHSADYIIAPDGAKPTGEQAKYGITCVGCHTPHEKGTATGAWDSAFTPQLRTDSAKTLCVTCHNGEIPDGSTASPGATVHHPMKEMMNGYGAIDVASFPSVHKGKCVQCHMPPTTLSGHGGPQQGANHTFKIITPATAAAVTPMTVGGVTYPMQYSACTTCHSRPDDQSALWLQDTIDQRQEWTKAKIVDVHAALDAAAVRLGYADESAAQTALVAIAEADRTASQTNFLKAFTNLGYVESEGSFGLHNWDYSRAIVNTALVEVNSVEATPVPTPWTVSFKASKKSVHKSKTIKYSGTVAPAASLTSGGAKVIIQRKVHGAWKTWRSTTCYVNGSYRLIVKMKHKGTFYLRARMPANSKQLVGNSAKIKVVVK